MKIINPSTGKPIQTLIEDDRASISKKFLDAKRAFQEFRKVDISKRIEYIKRFQSILRKRIKDLARILTSETGKPIKQSEAEIQSFQNRIDFFIQNIHKELMPKIMRKNKEFEEKISYEPLGVIANISAWNYPYFVGGNVFIAAILCGNSVLYKPSEHSTLTGLEIGRLFEDSDLPDKVFQVVVGQGVVGEVLLDQSIDGLFFTGSYPTGMRIAERISGRMIPMQLELGGKDPAYIHLDVDLEKTARSVAEGVFYNNGQSCCALERLYIHEAVYQPFLEKFIGFVSKFKIGDPFREDTFIGPLARREQISYLEEQIQDALDKKARLLFRAEKVNGEGYYFRPAVLIDTDHSMMIMKNESFGPIVGIQKVNNEQEGMKLMQDTNYGLTASVYSKDKRICETILREMNTGTVYWNTCDRVSPFLPWSGRKNSGIGSTLSLEGIRAFLKPKAWHLCQP